MADPFISILDQEQRRGEDGIKMKVALVAGSTGLVGRELVSLLLTLGTDWELIYGIARRPAYVDEKLVTDCQNEDATKYQFLQCDLLDRDQTAEKLSPLASQVTHLFWVTWASQFPIDTSECFAQNRTMLSNTLDALLHAPFHKLRHVSLQTGTKHYVSLTAPGSNGPYIEEDKNEEEEQENDEGNDNFYYALEKLVMEHAKKRVFSWSVHRPSLLFGASNRSYYNIVGTLCVYASLCRYIHMPFHFYGTEFCWEEHYIDMSDARLVAGQHIWWASSSPPLGKGEAFNTVDFYPFIWKEIWPVFASKFSIEKTEDMNWVSEEHRYNEIMDDKAKVWEEIIEKNGLRKTRIEELANWELLDSLLRFPGKLLASPVKAKSLGFAPVCGQFTAIEYVSYWVDRMREMRLVP